MQYRKSIQIDYFIEKYKRALTRQEKLFEISKNEMFSGWKIIVNELYEKGYFCGYREKEHSYQFLLNYYKKTTHVEHVKLLRKLKFQQKLLSNQITRLKNNDPRALVFIETKTGIKKVQQSGYKTKAIGGKLLLYIK